MLAPKLRPGAVGNVVHKVFASIQRSHDLFLHLPDQRRSILLRRGRNIFLILCQLFSLGEGAEQPQNIVMLFFRLR